MDYQRHPHNGAAMLRRFLPRGVCEPPNPFVYRQLATLCADEQLDAGQLEAGADDGAQMHLHRHEHYQPATPEPDYSDPNQRYIWDEPEECCRADH